MGLRASRHNRAEDKPNMVAEEAAFRYADGRVVGSLNRCGIARAARGSAAAVPARIPRPTLSRTTQPLQGELSVPQQNQVRPGDRLVSGRVGCQHRPWQRRAARHCSVQPPACPSVRMPTASPF
jgi:hypothetical protein